ncbi:Gldg family protein [Marinifilum sp.]|uniref:Gldg family protein n=1 Tax=Marinifilum sp. TaxID=2033137 RepID=UPI003BAA25EF
MNKLVRIAKLELSTLFFSPIAWIVLFVFSLLCGISLFGFLEETFLLQLFYEEGSGQTLSFLVDGDSGYFRLIRTTLFVFIPLLTMGIISRENHSGSIKLLYSSPIRIRSIIAGKYLAILVYVFLLMFIAFIGAFYTMFYIENADFNIVLSGLLILFLMAAAYAAIGLYVSSLSHYPVVDVIVTIAILGFLDLMLSLVREVPVARDIFYWFSLSQHTRITLMGLITTGDIAYFLMIIILFLSLTWFKLNLNRLSSREKMISRLKMFGVILCIAAIGYILTHPKYTYYKDVTRNQSNTIGTRLQNVLEQLDGEQIKMTNYANISGGDYAWLIPKSQMLDKSILESYRRFLPDMNVDYIMYVPIDGKFEDLNELGQKNIEKALNQHKMKLGKDVVTSGELKDKIDLKTLANNMSVRVLEYKDRRAIIPIQYSSNDLAKEQEWTAAFLNLADSCCQVAFLTGNGERAYTNSYDRKDNWGYFFTHRKLRGSLINQGFEIREVDPRNAISEDVDILVIADPTSAYSEEEMTVIHNYVDRGGNLIIAGEPEHRGSLNPLLSYLGVELLPGVIYNDDAVKHAPDLITGYMNHTYGINSEFSLEEYGGSIKIGFPGATALKYEEIKGFKVTPSIRTKQDYTWMEAEKMTNLQMVKYNPELGEKKESFALGIDLVREINGKQQKIIIFSDADFITQKGSETASRTGSHSNFSLITEIVPKWFTNSLLPPKTVNIAGTDTSVTIGLSGLTIIKLIFWVLIPLSILSFGCIILIKRKRM